MPAAAAAAAVTYVASRLQAAQEQKAKHTQVHTLTS